MKDRSQTVGTGKRNKRVIERGAMRTREGQTNTDEELLRVPGAYYMPGTVLSALYTYLTH